MLAFTAASVETPVTPSVPPIDSLPVTVEVPTIEDVAYELTAKTLRNLLANVPSERVPVVVGKISAARLSVLKNEDSPVTDKVPEALIAVEELRVAMLASVEKSVVAVSTVVEAVFNTV